MNKKSNRMSCKQFIGFLFFLLLLVGHPVFAQGIRGQYTATTPTMATGTSVTMVTAKSDRVSIEIQNNSAGNICCSLTGATLTGVAPTATNICRVIAPGAVYLNPNNFTPTQAITCYQASGGTINTVLVQQG
jgi:hypothetical protein